MSIDVVYVWCGEPATEYCKFNKDIAFSVKSCHGLGEFGSL